MPRTYVDKIALQYQKQKEETAVFEAIMQKVSAKG